MKVKGLENIQFTDIFDIKSIQTLQDSFSNATGVASIITHPDGTPITQPSNFCSLCKLIRTTEKGRQNCYNSDAKIGRQHKGGPIYQKCLSGGLWDAGASISIADKHIANWLIGQVRNEAFDDEGILQYAREIGANEDEFRKALENITTMSLEQFEKISDSLYIFANQLSEKAFQNLQLELHRDQLESLVQEKTKNLERVNKELMATNADLKNSLQKIKDMQVQLFQAEKLASLGTLTSGVAHEINNPLNYIIGAYSGLNTSKNTEARIRK